MKAKQFKGKAIYNPSGKAKRAKSNGYYVVRIAAGLKRENLSFNCVSRDYNMFNN